MQEIEYIFPTSHCVSKIAYDDHNYNGQGLGVIVTHPWALLGGSMENNIVVAICAYFQQFHITTLRFNFAGPSIGTGYPQVAQIQEAANVLLQGTFRQSTATATTEGEEEAGTVAADDDGGAKRIHRILLIGYSYGSILCASASSRITACIGCIWIAPPFGVRHLLYLWSGNAHITDAITQTKVNTTQHNAKTEHAATTDLSSEAEEDTTDAIPQLLILGDHDNFTSVITFRDIVATMDDTTTTGIVLGNTDHFFRNKEHSILTAIGDWIVDEFSNCSDGDVIGALQNIIGQVRPIDPTEQDRTGSDRRATNLSYTSPTSS